MFMLTLNFKIVHGVSVIYKPGSMMTTPIITQGSYILAAGVLTAASGVDTTATGGKFFVLPKADTDRCIEGFWE